MLFNSIDFAIFLPIVFAIYWVFKSKRSIQNVIILIASYVFYGWWDWRFLSLIILSTIVDFWVGINLSGSQSSSKRKILLGISLAFNLGLLGFFKYYNFFLESFIDAFSLFGVAFTENRLDIILPVGISFYTFQTLSYSIDVYRNRINPTRDPIAFASFVSFFPQLVAGPIERATHLLPQFQKEQKLSYEDIEVGARNILFGLFKKVVIADRLAIVVNEVFAHSEDFSGFQLVLAILFFSFQIYCDFSGYSQIAIGTARLFGFQLMQNFNSPYLANSLGDFWRRWHISLSTWFRDYVYIPLGGNRGTRLMWYRNISVVFVVSGLWHGANWTFVVWGAIHGIALIFEAQWNYLNSKLFSIPLVKTAYVWAIVGLGWVFFRSDSLYQATSIIGNVLNIQSYQLDQLSPQIIPPIGTQIFSHDVVLSLIFITSLLLAETLESRIKKFEYWHSLIRIPVYSVLILLIYIAGVFQTNQFIYFQF